MSQSYEKIVARLNNLQAISPLLGALRTISMGTWQMAQNKLQRLAGFQENYYQILRQISPLLSEKTNAKPATPAKSESPGNNVALLIGTEGGDSAVSSMKTWPQKHSNGSKANPHQSSRSGRWAPE